MRESSDNSAKEKLYRKFKSGDMHAFADLLEGEREGLYDYLLRLTGQVSRSMDTIDEVYQSLNEDTLDTIDSYVELKICLYTTARKFNADIWNAETSRLMNPTLEGPPGAEFGSPAALKERQVLALADRQLRGMPGREREVVVLSALVAYDVPEISEIMGISEHEVETLLVSGLRRVTSEGGAKSLAKLPLHTAPPRSSQATVNLSMVMQGIKTRPAGLWSLGRIALLGIFALVAIGVVVGLTNPDLYRQAIESLRAGREEKAESRSEPKSESRMPPPIDGNVPRPAP